MLTRDQLPNDIEQLKDIIMQLNTLIIEQQALYESRIQALEHQLQQLQRQQYGARSEKQKPAKKQSTSDKKATPHGRTPLPDDLPREDIVYTLPAEQLPCPGCGSERTCIGEAVSEQLDYVPGHLKVIRHKRQKYACQHCQGEIVIAELPRQPIDKGLPTAGPLAQVVISKYEDHLPLYRQEQQFARQGMLLSRSTFGDWIRQCGQQLAPVVDAMKPDAFKAPKLHTDDTTVPVQAQGKTKLGRLWIYLSQTRAYPVIALYDYSPSRAGRYPQAYLANYQGYIQADAFAGYDELYQHPARIEVACWAHVRRKFEEIVKQSTVPGRAQMAMDMIGELYKIERAIKPLSYALRYEHRREYSQPLLDKFKAWLDAQTVLPKSPLGKAINYAKNHWQALTNYLLDGCLEIDNNAGEQGMRPLAIGRKNWLFAGNDQAAEHAAVMYSLIQTCKLNGINTFAYLKDVLARLPTTKMADIHTLLPYHWQPSC